MMRYYELTINTKEADSLIERVTSYLPNPPVRQQKSPFFLSLEFYTEPEKIQELEKVLKADSLKYMILIKNLQKEAKPRRKPLIEKSPTFQKKVGEKVDINAIDKKLKEILNE